MALLFYQAKKKSNIKRWMAFSDKKQNGNIFVNSCLFDIIKEDKRVISLLPVGIEKVTGEFKKGDLVEISSPKGEKIGVGIARYHSEKLKDYLGLKNKPEFIHYDQLHIQIGK